MYSKDSALSIYSALNYVKLNNQSEVTKKHLLLSLLNNQSAMHLLSSLEINISALRKELIVYLNENTASVAHTKNNYITEPHYSPDFQNFLERLSISNGQDYLLVGEDLLLELFLEEDIVLFLKEKDLANFTQNNEIIPHSVNTENNVQKVEFTFPAIIEDHQVSEAKLILNSYAVDLNEQVLTGTTDPIIGREEEIQQTMQTLCRRTKSNPLLVGQSGVGKTAIVQGVAEKICRGEAPAILADSKIYSLDIAQLVAGTKFRGDLEERLKKVLAALNEIPNSILFIDDIQNIVSQTGGKSDNTDISNLLKPTLARGNFKCIGAIDEKSYRHSFEKDTALARRFQRITVKAPSKNETLAILKGIKGRYETHHKVKYSNPVLEKIIELSDKYLKNTLFPDKAIDLLDELGSVKSLEKMGKQVKISEVENLVAKLARIPVNAINRSEKKVLAHLSKKLGATVYGQEKAITALSNSVKLARSGLSHINKPIGSFLFTGPTGVGKTELARQLSESLGINLARFDMSEYMESHSVAKLIGTAPGYVGYQEGGLLTNLVRDNPHTVLLLDEIEKAHSDIYNLLLQVMDYGTLTDSNGAKIDFRHTIIIMTSNVGAEELTKTPIGFMQEKNTGNNTNLKRAFSPEFLNRLSAVIPFNNLNEGVLENIVEKFITELSETLQSKNIELSLDKNAKKWLMKNGYDYSMGARPMERVIKEHIKKPLADELLFGKLRKGGSVRIEAVKDELRLHIDAA